MVMALRDRFLDGPRLFYGGLCLTQTGGHADLRLPSEPTNYLNCGAEHNVFGMRAGEIVKNDFA